VLAGFSSVFAQLSVGISLYFAISHICHFMISKSAGSILVLVTSSFTRDNIPVICAYMTSLSPFAESILSNIADTLSFMSVDTADIISHFDCS
jgi:hypothetical protein